LGGAVWEDSHPYPSQRVNPVCAERKSFNPTIATQTELVVYLITTIPVVFYAACRSGSPFGVRALSMLSELNVGEFGYLVALDLPESVQNHLMHMGFVPDALVTALRRAPAGDPTVYGIDGMEIALRHETADSIHVRAADSKDSEHLEGEEAEELFEAAQ
jgi:ferrous iron transport protein A